MLNVLICTLALAAATTDATPDSPPEARLVKTIALPHRHHVETSGNLLVGKCHATNEITIWDSRNLDAKPQTTLSLCVGPAVVMGDGTIIEDILLGTPHEMLKQMAERKKEARKTHEGGQADDGLERLSEKHRAEMREFEEEEEKRERAWADEEDRIVARMKYLQEMKKSGKEGLVARSLSGGEFSMIDLGKEHWSTWGCVRSPDGKALGVCQYQCGTGTKWGVRVGILDARNRSVHWIGTTSADCVALGYDPTVMGPESRISNDGKRLLLFGTFSHGRWVCMIDASRRAVLWEHCGLEDPREFHSGGLSPDGKKAYVLDKERRDSDGFLYCFDGDTGKQTPIGDSVIRGYDFAMSPDGRWLALTKRSNIVVYEAASGDAVQRVPLESPFASVAFSPDGKFLAVTRANGISIYDISSGTKGLRGNRPRPSLEAPAVATLELPTLGGPGYPYLETSGHLLSAMLCAEKELRYWDWNDLKAAPKITPSLGPDLATVLADGSIAEYVQIDPPEGSEETKPSHDHDRIVAKTKYLQEIKRTGGRALMIRNVAGDRFTTIDCGDTTHRLPRRLIHSPSGNILVVLASGMGDKIDETFTGAGIVDRATRTVRWVANVSLMEDRKEMVVPCDAAVSNNGKRLARFGHVVDKGGWLCMFDANKRAVLWEIRGMPNTVCFSRGVVSPDGKRVYAADDRGGVYCFDGDTGKQLTQWDLSGAIVLSPDGRRLAVLSGGVNSRVSVYDTQTGKLQRFARPPGPHCDATFSPDGKYLAIGVNKMISIHDLTAATDKRHESR